MIRSPACFRDGHRLAGDHRFVDGGLALLDDAVDGDRVAGTDAQPIAHLDLVERHVFFPTIRANAPRPLGRQLQERADRGAGAAARAQLQHLSEQHQRHDHRGGLEVDGHAAVVSAERRRKQPGREHGDQAVGVRDRDAEADQREHVRAAVRDRVAEADEERPAAPQHDRRGERQLEPRLDTGRGTRWRSAGTMLPIASTSSGAVTTALTQNRRVMSTSSGLCSPSAAATRGSSAMPQIGHAPGASRTISGCIGQVHWPPAGAGGLRGRLRRRGDEPRRIGRKQLQAVPAAEVIRLPGVDVAAGGARRVDGHAADGIDHGRGGRVMRAMRAAWSG